jgi:sugar O-acyltransferase (sialic acid O-acetyltransferase NeuD family)
MAIEIRSTPFGSRRRSFAQIELLVMSTSGKPLLIVGNGEIASMAYEYFTHDSGYKPVAFTIGKEYIKTETFEGLPLLPIEEAASEYPPQEVTAFVAIGDNLLNRVRAHHFHSMKKKGYALASYVSSRLFRWHNVEIGENCFIQEDNTLQAFVKIRDNVTLWSGNHIGHRSVIESHVFVTSHVVISGFCRIGSYSFLGVNSSVANGVEIAPDNFIAMGAAVTASTEADRIYMGVPAKPRDVSAKAFCKVRDDL